jgi:hypothetical protein
MGNPAFRFVSAADLRLLFSQPPISGERDPNVFPYGNNGMPYDPSEVWNQGGGQSAPQVVTVDPTTGVATPVNPPPTGVYVNPSNRFNIMPFSQVSGVSIQFLQKNLKRSMLIIQNQSTANNLWYNFGQPAAVNVCQFLVAGQTIGYDVTCPSDAVYIYFDGTGNNAGVIQEATRQQ